MSLSPKQLSLAAVVFWVPVLCCLLVLAFTVRFSPVVQVLFAIGIGLFSVVFSAEVLVRQMPSALDEIAKSNCYRMTGEKSGRRTARERKAIGKIRRDFWAVGLIAMSLWAGVGFVFHAYYVPIPVAVRGLLAFDSTSEGWVDAMQEAGVERDVESAVQNTYGGGPKAAAERTKKLWAMAPLVAVAVIALGLLTVFAIHFAYQIALRDYHKGLLIRQSQNADRDIRRMQENELRAEVEVVS